MTFFETGKYLQEKRLRSSRKPYLDTIETTGVLKNAFKALSYVV